MLRYQTASRPVMGSAGTELIFHIILGLFAACCILPFIFVVIISFSSESSIKTIGYGFLLVQWSLEAYRQVFKLGDQLWLRCWPCPWCSPWLRTRWKSPSCWKATT